MRREELLKRFESPICVLDHGYIKLVDVMGDESSIVSAARTSYVGHEEEEERDPRQDRRLLRLLFRSGHTSPFEMVEFKIQIKIPMDSWRQMIRQRTANVNEYSTRYREAVEEVAGTESGKWRLQSRDSKQGSAGLLESFPFGVGAVGVKEDGRALTPGEYLTEREGWLQEQVREVYQERLEFGIAREQARKDLSLSNYTVAVWKIDGNNLLKFLGQRLASDAQEEIREYAKAIYEIVKVWLPVVSEAFEDYVLSGVKISGPELKALRSVFGGFLFDDASFLGAKAGIENKLKKAGASKREIRNFLKVLGLVGERGGEG